MVRFLALFILIFLTVGCANAGTTAPQPMLQDIAAADARATLEVLSVVQTANAKTMAEQTAVAGQATTSAVASMTAVAGQMTREAETTRQAIAIEQTRTFADLSADQTRTAMAVGATSVAVTIAAEQTREQQRAENVAALRASEIARAQSQQKFRNLMNAMYAVLLGVLISGVFALAVMIPWRIYNVTANPVRVAPSNGGDVNILVVSDGLFGTAVVQPPKITATKKDAPLLEDFQRRPVSVDAPNSGHVLIAGESGSGKSSAERWVLENRTNVVVCDPHAAPNEWNHARVITDTNEMLDFFDKMIQELELRKRARNNGTQIEFHPMTVATDEMPAIVDELGADAANEAWSKWLRQGRKFGLYIVMSTQSTRVKTLGISGEGDLVQQFGTVINLGMEARRKFSTLVDGMERPAVIEQAGMEPRAVVIPYVPPFNEDPDEPETMEETVEEIDGFETPYGPVTEDEARRIMMLAEQGNSLRSITKEIYDATGGNGFYKVKWILAL